MSHFTAEQLEDFNDCFKEVDKDGDGMISSDQLGALLRIMGQNPSQGEIERLTQNGSVSFQDFLCIMQTRVNTTDTYEDILRAFKVFDPSGSGYISNFQFRRAMTSYGEQFDDEQVDEMIREAGSDANGNINYTEFVQTLFNGLGK